MSFTPEYRHLGRFSGEPAPTAAETSMTQRMAASALILKLEKICSSGVLPEESEANARVILADAYRAFGFPSIAERS